MTQLDDKSGSQDIAAYYAALRTGEMAQCNEPYRSTLAARWLVAWAFGFALAGAGLALLLGDVPERYEAPRGYDVCTAAKC